MIPDKIRTEILEELKKNKRFKWYQGWERASGYIFSELRSNQSHISVRFYCEWKKKKEPSPQEQDKILENELEKTLTGKCHPQNRRDFKWWVIENYFKHSRKMFYELQSEISDNIKEIIQALENSDDFVTSNIQNFHNSLKNLETQIQTEEALEAFTDTLEENSNKK